MTNSLQRSWFLIVATALAIAPPAFAGNYGMPGHGERLGEESPFEHAPGDLEVEAGNLDDHQGHSENPDDLVVESGDLDDHLGHSENPDDLVVDSQDPDSLVVQPRTVDQVENAAIAEARSDDTAALLARDWNSRSPEQRALRQALQEAGSRFDLAKGRYGKMMRRDYPRGDARERIIAERDDSRGALQRVTDRYRQTLEEAGYPASN